MVAATQRMRRRTMVLKEWSEAWNIYKTSGTQLRKALVFPHPAWSYRYFWSAQIGFILAALLGFIGIFTRRNDVTGLGWCLVILMTVLAIFMSEKVLIIIY
jgi:uncharacterized membrane protein